MTTTHAPHPSLISKQMTANCFPRGSSCAWVFGQQLDQVSLSKVAFEITICRSLLTVVPARLFPRPQNAPLLSHCCVSFHLISVLLSVSHPLPLHSQENPPDPQLQHHMGCCSQKLCVVPFFTQSLQPVLPELLNAFRSTFLTTNDVQEEPAKKPKGKNPHTQEDSYNLEALLYAGMGSCSQSPQCFQIKFFLKTKHNVQEVPAKKQKEWKHTHSGVCIPNFLGMEALFLSLFFFLVCNIYYYLEKRLTKAGKQEPFCRKSSQQSHTLPRVEHRIDEKLLSICHSLSTPSWTAHAHGTILFFFFSHLQFLFLSSLS